MKFSIIKINPILFHRPLAEAKFQMPKVEMPKVDVKAKLTSMNESIRNARLPSPQEIKNNYKNSNFVKSFSQPLAVRNRVEEMDEEDHKEFLRQKKTPAQWSQMNHPLDFPMPKIKFSSPSFKKEKRTSSAEDKMSPDARPLKDSPKARSQGAFPLAWTHQKYVTSNKVITDEKEAHLRRELVKNKSPAQLAQFNSISDFPVPSKVKSLLSPSERKIMSQKQKKASEEANSDPWTTKIGNMFKNPDMSRLKRTQSEMALSATMPKGPKLITKVKVEPDTDEISKRRALNAAKTPAELAQIHSFSEIPIPGTLKRMVKGQVGKDLSHSLTALPSGEPEDRSKSPFSAMTLKKSLNSQCVVRSRLEDPNVQAARQEVVKTKTVAELSQITSLADIPIPSKLQAIIERRPKSPVSDYEPSEPEDDLHEVDHDIPNSTSPISVGSNE